MLALGHAVGSATVIAPTAALVILGSLAATYAVDWARDQGFHIDVKGSDAIYPFATAVLMLSVSNNAITRGLALGMISSGASVVVKDYGLINL